MKLYYAETLSPRKACAVAKLLGSPVDYVEIDFVLGDHRTPEFAALNPNKKVPVLVDGDTVMTEANAIMCYLADKAGSDLWPKDERQIEIIRWLGWDADHFTRYTAPLYFEYVIKPHYNMGPPDAEVVAKSLKSFRTFAKVLDDHLQGRDYVVGDSLTVADFAIAVTLAWAEESQIPLGDFPEIKRWNEGLHRLDAWRDPWPAKAA